jgi:hypothetical protein
VSAQWLTVCDRHEPMADGAAQGRHKEPSGDHTGHPGPSIPRALFAPAQPAHKIATVVSYQLGMSHPKAVMSNLAEAHG